MAEINKKQIANMEDEFLKLQRIEIGLSGENPQLSKAIKKYGTMLAIYKTGKKVDNLIDEINGIIAEIAKTGRVRGKVMSLKTMNEYLAKQDRVMHKQRVLDMIDRLNTKRAKARAKVYTMELAKEKGILQQDIDIFFARAEAAGYTQKEILKQLVRAAEDGTGPLSQFQKRVESVERDVLRREASASEIDEYRKVSQPNEKWEWITISTKPCPDCQIRAGVVMTYDEWNDRGLPGEGRTICKTSCMCKLMPVSVADELFPEVKTYNWNKKSGVLTTASEMRTFGAEKNKS